MDDKRYILLHGKGEGPFSLNKLMTMSNRREIDHKTLFWSGRDSNWHVLREILFDIIPTNLDSMKEAGVEEVEVLGSGSTEDCQSCKSLHNQTCPIDQVPALSPPG